MGLNYFKVSNLKIYNTVLKERWEFFINVGGLSEMDQEKAFMLQSKSGHMNPVTN